MVDGSRRGRAPPLFLLVVMAAADALSTPPPSPGADSFLLRSEIKTSLLTIGATSDRGQFASEEERGRIAECVARLECLPSDASRPSELEGEWDLVLTDVEPFRASPFWWQLKRTLDDFRMGAGVRVLPAHRLATSVGEIGRVRQRFENMEQGADAVLTSEVDLRAGFLPGVPLAVRGTVVTTASVEVVGADGAEDAGAAASAFGASEIAAKLVRTAVRSSRLLYGFAGAGGATSMGELSLPFLDAPSGLPVGDLFDRLGGDAAAATKRPRLRTTYLDDEFRISRTEDEHYFVFRRAETGRGASII